MSTRRQIGDRVDRNISLQHALVGIGSNSKLAVWICLWPFNPCTCVASVDPSPNRIPQLWPSVSSPAEIFSPLLCEVSSFWYIVTFEQDFASKTKGYMETCSRATRILGPV